MDRFIKIDCSGNKGLDLIKIDSNLDYVNDHLHKINRHYNDVLGEFKHKMIKKITRFDPIQKKDSYDIFLLNIWLYYIMGNKSKQEYIDIFKVTGIEINTQTDNISKPDQDAPVILSRE
jgi:hypothetical protein